MNKKAFTLIELLVVIAIIALLLSILLPALKTVKQMAGSVVCTSNQRQILTAWYLYAEDNDSKVCSAATYNYDPQTGQYDWVEGTVATTTTEQAIYGTGGASQGITGGALYPYYEDPKLLHCPNDKRYLKPPTNPGYFGDGAYRTYSFIIQMNSIWDSYFQTEGWALSQTEIFTKTTDVGAPGSKYVLVEENDNRGYNWGQWVMDLRPTNLRFVDPFAVFHNMRSTLGFADGHAEKIVWKDQRTEDHSEAINDGSTDFFSPVMLDNEDLQWLRSSYAKKTK